MRKYLPAAAILFAAASSASTQLFYEPFDYGSSSIGQPFANTTAAFSGYVNPSAGQQWFTSAITVAGSANSGDDRIISGNLANVTGLTANQGNRAGSTVADEHVNDISFTPTSFSGNGTQLYSSVIFTINNVTSVITGATGAFVYGFGTTNYFGTQGSTPTVLGSSLQVRHDQTDPTKFNVGLRPNNGTIQWDTTDVYTPGTPVFLVFGYTFGATSTADTQQMWVNPSAATFGAATPPAATFVNSTNGVNAPLKSIFINRGANNTASPTAMQFDEIRVDNSWAQVTTPTGSTYTGANSSNWSDPLNWDSVPNAAGAFANFRNPAGGTVTVDAAQTVGSLTIASNGSYTISGTNSITMSTGGTSAAAINIQAQMDPTGPAVALVGSHTISAPVVLANNTEVNVALNQTLTMSGNVSETAPSMTLTKNGPGTLLLQGTNSYSNGTVVNSGTLAVNGDAALGAAPTTPTLNITLVKGTGGAIGILRFDADTTLDSNREIEVIQSGGGGPTINTNNHSVTIGGMISAGTNGANLIKAGLGTLTLTGDNSQNLFGGFENNLTINAGTVNVSQDINIGKIGVGVGLSGGTLQFGASFNPVNRAISIQTGGGTIDTNGFNTTIDGIISGTPNWTKIGLGTMTITAGNTASGTAIVSGGVLQLGAANSLNANQSLSVGASGSFDMNGFDDAITSLAGAGMVSLSGNLSVQGNNSTAFTGSMSGTGSFTKTSTATGTFTLSGTNTYSGPTNINAGTLASNGSNSFSPNSAHTIASGATMDLRGFTETVGSIAGAGTILVSGNLTTNGDNSTTTLTSALTGTASLIKTGSGTLHLPSFNLGGVTVNNGTLHIVPSGRATSSTSVLASAPIIGATGRLDVEDNAVIINYGSETTNATRDAVRNLLINGRNAPAASPAPWNGFGGITSSYANANGNGFNLAIGYADNATLAAINAAGSYTSFGGQTVASTTILVQMTRGADCNLDGVVDGSDVSIIGTHFNQPGSGQWYFGDFDYSGSCDGNDISVLGTTFGSTSPTLSPAQMTAEFGSTFTAAFESGQGGAAVPEPTSLTLLGLGGLALISRRRRKASL